ncbi:hypothetical protein FQN54_001073 [Arachnomyces sp. PD_36]|nr:hypothetical protein FQN54_001073 [Arachnomyces sp. PD_36]
MILACPPQPSGPLQHHCWSSSSRTAGSESQPNIHVNPGPSPTTAPPPPPPLQTGINQQQLSPRRRENVAQPPMLMTSLSGAQYQGLGLALSSPAGYTATPLSTTTLSSPFSLSQAQSQYHPSPGAAVRGTSPMAGRHSGGYNAPYNPQEWGPVGVPSPNVAPAPANNYTHSSSNVARQTQGPSTTNSDLPTPPPPYSPRHLRQQDPSRDAPHSAVSIADTASPSGYTNTPLSATSVPPETPSGYRYSSSRSRPPSLVQQQGESPSIGYQSSFPPPPPLGASSSRPPSNHGPDMFGMSPLGPRSNMPISPSPQTHQNNAPNQQPQSRYPPDLRSTIQTDLAMSPPGSRRAVSTGAIDGGDNSSRTSTRQNSRSPQGQSNWGPGMPLPPPPPGPPPTARSQSVHESTDRNIVSPTARRKQRAPPVLGTSLDRVPPTPAGWVDPDMSRSVRGHRDNQQAEANDIDIANLRTAAPVTDGTSIQPDSDRRRLSGGLFRNAATRDPSAKGIRERRIESKHVKDNPSRDERSPMSGNPWADAIDEVKPADLVLSNSGGGGLSRRRTVTKSTPRSSRSYTSDEQQLSARSKASSGIPSSNSAYSTPKPEPSPSIRYPDGSVQTPPFSPSGPYSPGFPRESLDSVPPKALPTPPLHGSQDSRPPSRLTSVSSGQSRPVSHLLHLPNDPSTSSTPLSPRRPPSATHSLSPSDPQFMRDAIQRHQVFIEKEAAATTEDEALKLFNDFIISESTLRRERYSRAWAAGSIDINNVRERLFESRPKPLSRANSIGELVTASPAQQSSRDSSLDRTQSRPETAWWNNYQPCLSPIASMSMSNDEMSSRGRPPSRWWESRTGSGSEGAERRGVPRSKRETKYMGLPRELREAMQWEQGQNLGQLPEESQEHAQFEQQQQQQHQHATYGANEYPPEKVGWHENPQAPHSAHRLSGGMMAPEEARKLDISRLVTLPPSYPRHYPAVNNNHPDLISYRTIVRSVTDLSEVLATKERYRATVENGQRENQDKIAEGRRQFRSNIQRQIEEGSISFAEAAEAEAALGVQENRREKDRVQAEFDNYKEVVVGPLNGILTERINKTTSSIDELRGKLFDAAQHETPNQTQEEGDEQPELLEKLTQLKWLFEAREQLHREVYDLLSERNEKYRSIVTLPYKQAKNEEKIRETDAFFEKDARDRRVAYETETLQRYEGFLDVIEENVVRGVEVQLSAFWDIAPSLHTVLLKVPDDLRSFNVQIPPEELDENPSYHRSPLQYLYSLLSHADKSTYQFIESQINLLCLLHEVKSGVMSANYKLMEVERIRSGESEDAVKREVLNSKSEEERVLTSDLKDKVATVEGQWAEALGSQLEAVKGRVRDWLVAEGGWDEMIQMEES